MRQFTKKLHLIGIGGAGMYPLAEVLHTLGHTVSGSDMQKSSATDHLEKLGVRIQIGHTPDLVKSSELVVYSSAVKETNPERAYAVTQNIPSIRRAELLGDLMRAYFTICIAGTHGKTTTTSLIGTVFYDACQDPTVLVGGLLRSRSSNAIVGNSNILIAEADEYDRSFLSMFPSMAVITNIDSDHLDCYRDYNDICDTFVKFTDRVPFYGAVVGCTDDDGVLRIQNSIKSKFISYGLNKNAQYRASDCIYDAGTTKFNVFNSNQLLGTISITIPGEHNVRNVLACIAVCNELGIPFDTIKKSLGQFGGVGRRFEIVGYVNEATIVDDYAHHPREIRATIDAARRSGFDNVIAVFQPHLYSRTRDFMDDFVKSLSDADEVIVTKIYKSREEPIPGVNAELIVSKLNDSGFENAYYIDSMDTIPDKVTKLCTKGTVILFMGAGDIDKIALQLVGGTL